MESISVRSAQNVRLAVPLDWKHLVGITNANNVGGESR